MKELKTGILGIGVKESDFDSNMAEKISDKILLNNAIKHVSGGNSGILTSDVGKNQYELYKDGNKIKMGKAIFILLKNLNRAMIRNSEKPIYKGVLAQFLLFLIRIC